jgi:hypothetical protein
MLAWYRQLDSAKGPLEVVAIVRDYLATWTPHDLSRIPQACRPGRVRDEEDIEILHSAVVDEYRNTRVTGEDLDLLQQLTSLLVRASIRIAELRDTASKGGSSAPERGPMKSASPRES